MTSFKLGADDGLGVAYLVGSGFQGGLPAYASNGVWCGVVWCQSAVSVLPNKFDHFRPNCLMWAVAEAVIGQFVVPLS